MVSDDAKLRLCFVVYLLRGNLGVVVGLFRGGAAVRQLRLEVVVAVAVLVLGNGGSGGGASVAVGSDTSRPLCRASVVATTLEAAFADDVGVCRWRWRLQMASAFTDGVGVCR